MDDAKTNSQLAQDPSATAEQVAAIQALFQQIAEKIIEQQEAIIGPIAVDRARSVAGLTIDWPQHIVDVAGDPQTVIDKLVDQYKELFGQIAVETCRDAVGRYVMQLPIDKRPQSLN